MEALGTFLKQLKETGHTVYVVGSVGAIPAIAASLSFWRLVEPYKDYIDGIRVASGSGIPLSLAASGMRHDDIRETLLRLRLKDVVEDIGFFAEHNQGEGIFGKARDLKAYYLRWYQAASTIVRHLVDHRIGIVRGENIGKLLRENLLTDDFTKTKLPLEVIATRLGDSRPYVFSKETRPIVPISDAVVASCAIRNIVAIQKINGENFIDAALKESIPLRSLLDTHIARGLPPEKLVILGTFVHTLPRQGPTAFHFAEIEKYASSSLQQDLFYPKLENVEHLGVKCLILEFDATKVHLPSADPFPDFLEFGAGFRFLRKITAAAFNSSNLEKLLRGVSIYLYKELNMEHLPFYLQLFDRTVENKLLKKINKFKP